MTVEHPTERAITPSPMTSTCLKGDKWWHGALIYQVYPRSFRDNNNDGIGDIRGCIDGLDHIVSLGVDAIWLSPFFKSPMCDFGYDVSDYLAIDPIFGTLVDFDELVEKAHQRGIKIIIDQVYSHTSDQHAWFNESRKDKTNPKADWYVWADPKADGSPPSNWQSVFGGAAWTWDSRRHQYYLHNFLSSQPDLNVHNREVQNALLDVAKFWLDRGVDGFRLDALNFSMHDLELRDNPPVTEFSKPPTRSFDYQHHIYNQSHADIPAFIERIRALIDCYDDRFTVAEVGGANALREMKVFTSDDKHLHSAYSFDYLYADDITPELVRKTMCDWPGAKGEGWPSWAFSNHDAPRAASRWAKARNHQEFSKFTLLLLMSLRGNIFLYQGEELGLQQADIPFDKLQDPEAIANWPETLGRDGARTPLPWKANTINGGFSKTEPWLPVDERHIAMAIDQQNTDPQSVLNFTRQLIDFRTKSAALRLGSITFLDAPAHILAFTRTYGDENLLCVFNFSAEAISWSPSLNGDMHLCITANIDNTHDLPKLLPAESGYISTL